MNWILNALFAAKLEEATDRYLGELADYPRRVSSRRASRLLEGLRAGDGPKVILGETERGDLIEIPLGEVLSAHGLLTGGTGCGKTSAALLVASALIESLPQNRCLGLGVLDAKGDLYRGVLYLLLKRLQFLSRTDPGAARELRRSIVICDFACRDAISPYNVLAPWAGADPDYFASSRTDLLLDLLPGGEHISLAGVALLQKLILLLSEFRLPITMVDEILGNPRLLARLLAQSRNPSVTAYFAHRFREVPQQTVSALRRRIDALFSTESVRLSLAGDSAPDFRDIQDHGRVVLINCFGENISRGVRRLLQALALSDITQAVFARRRKDSPYLWFCDEAQNFFLTEKLRENMADLLTMSRSFGSYFVLMTQNLSAAVQDARVMKNISTNVKWMLCLRGEPADCAFLKPALPVTGRKPRPRPDPFLEESYYSLAEERAGALDTVAQLPDRVGYLWLRAHSEEALKIKTRELKIPHGEELEAAALPLRRDPTVGARASRKDYERQIATRVRELAEEPEGDLSSKLKRAYRATRGEAEK